LHCTTHRVDYATQEELNEFQKRMLELMSQKKEDAEKKTAAKKVPAAGMLRGAKLAVPSGGTKPISSAVGPTGAAGRALVPHKPSSIWDTEDTDQPKAAASSIPIVTAKEPSQALPQPLPAKAASKGPALLIKEVRPLTEPRPSGVLPKRHLSISPTKRRSYSTSSDSRSPVRGGRRSLSRGRR
jgi:hypothetical protein